MSENIREYLNNRKVQWFLFFTSMCACVAFLGTLESNLVNKMDITYTEYFEKPFALSLDPFLYTYLVNGYAESDPPEPDPRYLFSHEETLLSAFVDYFIRTRVNYDALDATIASNIGNTIKLMGNHIRGMIYYKMDKGIVDLNPALHKPEDLQFVIDVPSTRSDFDPDELTKQATVNPHKLVWNVVPWCWDPILEEALHELGNKNGFLFVRGHVKNYRFPSSTEASVLASTIASVPVKTAYLHEHSYINFRNLNFRPPVYVSITCEPIQRKLRHFYTDRRNYRDYSGVTKIGTTADPWWNMTLSECMSSGADECKYEGVKSDPNQHAITWLPRRVDWPTTQFCFNCPTLGRKQSLEPAKTIVEADYAVVGTLEKLDETLDVLEAKVPQFFKGIKALYKSKLAASEEEAEPSYVISTELEKEMRTRFQPEVEFYDFVTNRLLKMHNDLGDY